jgi:hypothetical protein
MNALSNSFRASRSMSTQFHEALTLDAVRHYAPSAFAVSAHESRSSRYTYIPTSEVIAALMREGFQPFKAAQSRSRIEGKSEYTKHMIRFRHADSVALANPEAIPEVVLINSHDGTSAYKLFGGIFRMICTNGMIVADELIGSLSVQHKGNIVHDVIEGSFQIIGQTAKTLDVVNDWGNLQLTSGEQGAFADAARELRFADAEGTIKTPITAAQLLAPRRQEDANGTIRWRGDSTVGPKPDLWHTLNVVQENVIKGGLHGVQRGTDERGRMTRRNVTTREVRGIDQDVKLNRALWMLAERMAELKAAS